MLSGEEEWMKNLRGETRLLEFPRPADWYTGKTPTETIHSLKMPNQSNFTRQEVLDYFDNTWMITETLFSCFLREECFYRPPYHKLRHPMIFYYVHPAALYVNKFRVAGLIQKGINPYFEEIFETGVDEMSWDDLSKNAMNWPSIAECHAYRREVYNLVKNVILTHPSLDKKVVLDTDQAWAVFMGFEHERIHIETSSVLIQEMPVHLLKKPLFWPSYFGINDGDDNSESSLGSSSSSSPVAVPNSRKRVKLSSADKNGKDARVSADAAAVTNTMIRVAGGSVTLGKPREWASFGWDNEYGSQSYTVRDFEASKYDVTNEEYLQFVKQTGYNDRQFWTEEGWNWRCFRNTKWPVFWVPTGPQGLHQYKLRVIFDVIDMQPNWPVLVNIHEARAFCAWKSKVSNVGRVPYRLLSELEHNLIRDDNPTKNTAVNYDRDHAMKYGGDEIFTKANVNGQLAFSSPSPVNARPANSKGFHDVFGNVWQWCLDYFAPLDGFQVHPVYQDFSDPCFDRLHSIIMGGSFISTGDELSIWSRFHFRGHFFQHAGFRLARNVDGNPDLPETSCQKYYLQQQKKNAVGGSIIYESEKMLREYLDLHYGKPSEILNMGVGPSEALDFPRRCGSYAIEQHIKLYGSVDSSRRKRALDVGCAVGASSFELGKHFEDVRAFDISKSFIDAASHLAKYGSINTSRLVSGEVYQPFTATVDAPVTVRDRVKFFVGDACQMDPAWGKFDLILMANLICRVPEPMKCLNALPLLLNKGGILVLMTPFSWLKEFTPRENWLGGREDSPDSFAALSDALSKLGFQLVHRSPLPMLIREHERKFQYVISEASSWKYLN